MDQINVEATYEQGTLKLPHSLPLRDGEKVTVTIHPPRRSGRRRGLINWKGRAEDLDYLILSEDVGPLESS